MQKRILVVAHDAVLRDSRSDLLLKAGYAVSTVVTDDDALALLVSNAFDLVLIGRNSRWPMKGLDERLRERYPNQMIMKIAQTGEPFSPFCSRITGANPVHVLATLSEIFREPAVRAKNGVASSVDRP